MNVYADLHMHTTASDGIYPPEKKIEILKSSNISVFSISDHDTVRSVKSALQCAAENGMTCIPAVEFSCRYRDKPVHILGYMKEYETAAEYLEVRTSDRETRAMAILERLKDFRINVEYSAVLEEAGNSQSIGRPHIARTMFKMGYIRSLQEAFDRYIGDGKPCFVPKMSFEISDTVGIIKQARGIPVLAHPFESSVGDMLEEITAFGVEGIEVYTPKNSGGKIDTLREFAYSRKLLITGGTDYHGDRDYDPFGIDKETYRHFAEKWEAL